MRLRTKALIAFIIGLLIGVFALIGRAVDDDPAPAPTTTLVPSDGAQFRQWLCTNTLPNDGC